MARRRSRAFTIGIPLECEVSWSVVADGRKYVLRLAAKQLRVLQIALQSVEHALDVIHDGVSSPAFLVNRPVPSRRVPSRFHLHAQEDLQDRRPPVEVSPDHHPSHSSRHSLLQKLRTAPSANPAHRSLQWPPASPSAGSNAATADPAGRAVMERRSGPASRSPRRCDSRVQHCGVTGFSHPTRWTGGSEDEAGRRGANPRYCK